MQVIGLCRFSYLGDGGFQIEHQTLDERRAFLYDPVRLNERFRFFETFTLPSIRAQDDPDFVFIILISEDLPEPYVERLMAQTEDMPQVVLMPWGPDQHRKVCKEAINLIRDDGAPSIQFRLDDDDAVAKDFVSRLKKDAKSVQPLLNANRHVAIDYNHGYFCAPSESGLHLRETRTNYLTMGLGLHFRADCRLSVMNFTHNQVHHYMPTVTFSDSVMYLRGVNQFNDSMNEKQIRKLQLELADPETEAMIEDRFGLDVEKICSVFS